MSLDFTTLKGRSMAVMLGGTSPEREVSLQSGATVESALRRLGVKTQLVDPADSGYTEQLAAHDFAFLALHGGDGEGGVIQGALQSRGIGYSGSGVLGSALAMDKVRCKILWKGLGLPTAEFVLLDETSDWQSLAQAWPAAFVKPATGGSSIGMSRADDAQGLYNAWKTAAQFDNVVLAERYIEGDEYTVAVLGERALPVIRMETDNEFYDYDAKYLSEDTRYHCPCGLSAKREHELQELALQAFTSVGCQVWGRVDFMRDVNGQFYLLEVNTVPGMTSHSLVPMAARSDGLDLAALVGEIALHSLALGERS